MYEPSAADPLAAAIPAPTSRAFADEAAGAIEADRLAMSPLDGLTRALFRAGSALRGRRIFHPRGVVLGGRLVGGVDPVLGSQADGRALIRVSRAIGLPDRLGDPWGLGIRLIDAHGPGRHQDFLLVSSFSAVAGRHLLIPAWTLDARHFSSLLPFRVGGELALVGATVTTGRSEIRELGRLCETDELAVRVELEVAPLLGAWRKIAEISIDRRLGEKAEDELKLNPHNTGGAFEPVGFLNRIRAPAYRGSQAGWSEATPERSTAQPNEEDLTEEEQSGEISES
jgi:hypothetical protein